MSSPEASSWHSARRWLPGLVISLVAIALLLRLTDWAEVGRALAVMDLRWLPLALFFYLMSIVLRAFAWRTLLDGRASTGRAFLVLNEGYLLNNVLPFRLGELGRALLLGQSSGLSPFYVLSTIVIERAYDLAIAAGLLLATLPLVLELQSARPVALATLGLVILALTGLFLVARYQTLFKGIVERLAGGWGLVRRRILPRLDALVSGLGSLTRPLQFALSVILLVASWTFGAAEIHVLLNSSTFQAPFWWTGFVLGVLSLGIALPSAPAALGVYEAAVVGALAILGVPAAPALAFAIVAHLIHIGITGLIGTYALFRDGETISSLVQKVRGLQ